MRIGVDVTAIGAQPSGVGNYTQYLLNHLVEVDGGHEYLLLSNQPARPSYLSSTAALRDVLDPFPSRMLWMQCRLPGRLREVRPDVCHYPNSIGPLFNPCPYVVTIHDMTLSLLPRYHPWRKQLLVRPIITLVALHARQIITVSQNARADIMRLLHVPADRVVAIPEAAGPCFHPVDSDHQARVRSAFHIDGPFILYVGTLEPRKNLVRLIRAWHRIRRSGVIPHQLVVAGARGWQDRSIFEEVRRLTGGNGIIFTGYVPLEDLPALYSAADAFAFPSLYEGFGLPVIEAMACGTPALISSAPALVEVAGDAAVQVDAYSVEAISLGLERILTDDVLRQELRERGFQRARALSWTATATQTLQVYQHAMGTSLRPATAQVSEAG
jgi:glycosyltransferase involved in cell wall biosynthesis